MIIKELIKSNYKISLSIVFLISFYGFVNTLFTNSIFISQAVLEPQKSLVEANQNQGLRSFSTGSLASSFLNVNDKSSDVMLALEVLKSRDFFERLLIKENFEYELNNPIKINYFGSFQWNAPDEMKKFDAMHYRFINDHLSFSQNEKNSFVTIRISHFDKNVSRKWLQMIIDELNFVIKQIRLNQSEKTLIFLQKQISAYSIPEIRNSLASLITNEIRSIGLLSVEDEFVFRIIDKPRIPDERSRPNRTLSVIVWFFVAVFISLTLTILKFRLFRNKNL